MEKSKLKISKNFEKSKEDDKSCWVPPSVYKKPSGTGVFGKIWKKARELLMECDTLRVIGSSLRNEDWPLISLIFTSQVQKRFDIELIIPEVSATGSEEERKEGVMQRLRFLANMKPPSALPVFRDTGTDYNVFYSWLLNTANDIDRKGGLPPEDEFIREILFGDVNR